MNPLAVLELLEHTPGKNDKVQILKDHKSDELSELLHAAFDFNRKFHIKKFNAVCELTLDELALNHRKHHEFMEVLDLLQKRELTGNAAIQHVEWFFSACSEAQIKWYSRVLRKDLQAGFSESTANKAGYKIPKFEVMLAKDGKNSKATQKLVNASGFLSPKLDGYRCLAIKDFDEVKLYSRNGKEYTNFPTVVESIKKLPMDQIVLDGEIMSDDFQSMQRTAFASKRGTSVGDVSYHIFDMIQYSEWASDNFTSPAHKRFEDKAGLHSIIDKLAIDNLSIVTHVFTDSYEQALEYEAQCIEDGYEGAMFLPYDCVYYKGRKSNKLIKFKTMLSMECEIIGLTEGINKYEGMLGALKLKQENGASCDCGSGFNDEQRKEFWNNPQQVIGRTIEVKYQELTPDGIMRFPIFMRFRDDKTN